MRCSLCCGSRILATTDGERVEKRLCEACGGTGVYVHRDLKPANMIQREIEKLGGPAGLYPGQLDERARRQWREPLPGPLAMTYRYTSIPITVTRAQLDEYESAVSAREAIAAHLRRLVIADGRGLDELSRLLGWSYQKLSRMQRGSTGIDACEMLELGAVLGKSIAEMYPAEPVEPRWSPYA